MIHNRKKFRKFSGVIYVIFSMTLFVVCIAALFCEKHYLPRRLFLRVPAFFVYTILYLTLFLITYPKVF